MINNDTEKLLTAIKNSVLIKYAQSLALDTPKDNIISMPTVNFFETYVYEQKAIDQSQNLSEIQEKIKQQITYELNNHLYERQCTSLEMQNFLLDQTIQVHQNQIQMLKVNLQLQQTNKIIKLQNVKHKMINKHISSHHIYVQQTQNNRKEQLKQPNIQSDSHKPKINLNIYPCIKVEVTPQTHFRENNLNIKQVKQLQSQIQKQKSLHESQNNLKTLKMPKNQPAIYKQDQLKQRTMVFQKYTSNRQKNLKGIQYEIDFLNRAWKNAKQNNQKNLAKKYKKDLMNLLQLFWATANN